MARSSSGLPITFVVPGQRTSGTTRGAGAPAAPPEGLPQGRVKESVRVGAHRGGGGSDVRVDAIPGEDVVVLHVANGPALMLHPETARDLFRAQASATEEKTRGQGPDDPLTCAVPARLGWPLAETTATRAARGVVGDVLVAGLDVVTGLLQEKAARFAASAVVGEVDAQVVPGVHRLHQEGIGSLKDPETGLLKSGKPLVVFVHGTFSSTAGTFSKLWTQHPERVRELFGEKLGGVFALEHPTLRVSPVGNAIALARTMGTDTSLRLVTHSRGGLVAEVLARVCAGPEAMLKSLGRVADEALRQELEELARIVAKNRLRIERIVRVACPARGTLLASKRLDAYVSVFKWTLQLAGIPVLPELVGFLGEVAKRRAEPEEIPGLAAQIPDSPLVRWLNSVDAPIAGDLRVVAGDLQGDSVTSWLKTLLSDAFFWTDNDLVVQTRSMYGGTPRSAGASFVLDQGGSVSHFNYFANERTAAAIVSGVLEAQPLDFRTIGPLSFAGESSTGVRAARVRGAGAPTRPAVFVLPGILGSHLKVGKDRIWLGWRVVNGFDRLSYGTNGVTADGPIGYYYDDLVRFLAQTHEVIPFAFDWRRPMEDEARELATAVDREVAARRTTQQPVRILAHSMGGLVARTMQLEKPDVWKRMMAVEGARVLMLGTPNAGSWAPMQVLSGDDTFGNLLTAVGAPFATRAARQRMAQFPGFLQLQADLADRALGLGREARWRELAEDDLASLRKRTKWHVLDIQRDAYAWGVPPQEVLDAAVALRRRLDAQDLSAFDHQMLLVVGRARTTPAGFTVAEDGPTEGAIAYLDAIDDGDGRVPTERALLPGVRTFRVDAGHSDLPSARDAFKAYLELLEKGSTELLPRLPARAARGAGAASTARVKSRPSRQGLSSEPPAGERDVYNASLEAPPSDIAPRQTVLRVSVVNGDLSFVRQPLLLGHYRSSLLTGTERVMNRLVGGVMQDALTAGLYPDPPGSHQVFVNESVVADNPWRLPRPEAVVVAGLGEEGNLRPAELVDTVRQAVLAWVQRRTERPARAAGAPAPPAVPVMLELAATLLGSGGGIPVARSAQLVAQGVREANDRLSRGGWPQIGHLQLIELYLSRAGEAWRALRMQALAAPDAYEVSDRVRDAAGALGRPFDDGYRGAAYDQISAVTRTSAHGEAAVAYTVSTRRARSEVTAQTTQIALMRALVTSAATDRNQDPQIGRTLFQLLVPTVLEPFFGDTSDMLLELDDTTASIPWELLDTGSRSGADARPWAIRAKLLRKLRTEVFRRQTRDAAAAASALVIGEPRCDHDLYPELPAARAEAREVFEALSSPSGILSVDPVPLIRSEEPDDEGYDAQTIVKKLLERDWRIVHIAGHGELPERIGPPPQKEGDPPQGFGNPRGVVLSGGAFLGRNEIESMRVVPDLVFVNCCHLGARGDDRLLGAVADPPRFAAGVAEALIRIGVRCVVAAGWAVADEAARVFAATFYKALRCNQRFADAVAEARAAAMKEGGNTWAAYQCYGDPDWRLGKMQPQQQSAADELAGVGTADGLVNALLSLEVKSLFQGADRAQQGDRLRYLEARFAESWGGSGRIAEAFGAAWVAAEDPDRGTAWYERALAAPDGTASFKVLEQLANLRVRRALPGVPGDVALAGARAAILDAIGQLKGLKALQTTVERESLLGSAYKRLAVLAAQAGDAAAEEEAIGQMVVYYAAAERIAKETGAPNLYYPAMNRMAAELALHAGSDAWQRLDAEAVAAARASLRAKTDDDPDFWSVVGETELALYEALSAGALAPALQPLLEGYDDVGRRVTSAWRWKSVRDQLDFILPRYVARASAAEQEAARKLREHLTQLAAREERAAATPEAVAAPGAPRKPKKAAAKKKKPRRVRR
jgi:CHAT domain-containing protein